MKQAHLLRARLRRQGAVDHTTLEGAPAFEGTLGGVHLPPGEGHEAVALAHAFQGAQSRPLRFQGQQALVLEDLQGVACTCLQKASQVSLMTVYCTGLPSIIILCQAANCADTKGILHTQIRPWTGVVRQ